METEQLINDFIQHCGEMGSQWGFNRTVGQMFGLLLLSEVPLT
ncbi:MAG: transcriptional regulator, partial [Pseudomonadota bacterium]|nr:transcriptional regulator [Pseudomonadota bacterium]